MFIGLAGKHPNKYPNKIPLISQQYPINIPWISRSLPRFFAFPSHFQSNDMNGQAGGANVRPGHRRRLGGGNTKKAKRWESSHVEPIRYKPGYVIGGLEHFFFLYIGNNHPNWLSYFSEGLKPPTSYVYAYILSEMGNSFSPVSLSGIQLYIPMYWLVSSFFMAGKLPTSSHPKTSVVWWIANAINHGKKGLLGIVYGIGFTTSINGLVDGKIYRKPWFLPWNIGLSCRFSLKPIQWSNVYPGLKNNALVGVVRGWHSECSFLKVCKPPIL